jgi:glycosyltransferase involved in cell wall biosynthesis
VAERVLRIGVDGRELIGQPTGVGRYVERVLRTWATDPAFRHEVTVFLPTPPPARLIALGPAIRWRVEDSKHSGTWWEQTRLSGAIGEARADVFFAAGYTAPLRVPCPFVVAIYDVSFAAHPEWFAWREGLRRRWLTARAARHAQSIVTISEFSAAEIVRYFKVDRARIRIAPPGPPDAVPASASERDPIVLFVGSLFNRRHIPELIEAFARVVQTRPGARLVLVGANRTNPAVDPHAIAATLGIGHAVDWRAYVDDGELERLYASSRAFAFLSDYEGFAMTPMEALAHGVPSVLIDTPVAREVYGDGAVLVDLDTRAVAAALDGLLQDASRRDATLAAGRRRLGLLSWTRTASTVLQALEAAAR